MATHKWTTEDEILALALYFRRKRYPANDSVIMQLQAFMKYVGISTGSLNVKMMLFEALESGKKPLFGQISSQTQAVWDEYSSEPFILLREAREIMERDTSQGSEEVPRAE